MTTSPRRARSHPERDVQNAILKHFATVSWMRLWRINVGVYLTVDGRRRVRTAPTGYPDLSGILPGGRALFIEVKAPDGQPTTEQWNFGETAQRFGAVWCVARSVADVEQALRVVGYAEYVDGHVNDGRTP